MRRRWRRRKRRKKRRRRRRRRQKRRRTRKPRSKRKRGGSFALSAYFPKASNAFAQTARKHSVAIGSIPATRCAGLDRHFFTVW